MDIKIISMEECEDEAYGNSLIQYQCGDDSVGFLFSQVDISKKNCDLSTVLEEIEMREKFYRPSWKELSESLLAMITENPFDMNFIEYESFCTPKLADSIWEEAKIYEISDVVEHGSDCYLTIYAGAMCEINWRGHHLYGEACLTKTCS